MLGPSRDGCRWSPGTARGALETRASTACGACRRRRRKFWSVDCHKDLVHRGSSGKARLYQRAADLGDVIAACGLPRRLHDTLVAEEVDVATLAYLTAADLVADLGFTAGEAARLLAAAPPRASS